MKKKFVVIIATDKLISIEVASAAINFAPVNDEPFSIAEKLQKNSLYTKLIPAIT